MSALRPLPELDEAVTIVHMLTPSDAVDLYLGDCQRRGLALRTRDRYRESLSKFTDSLPPRIDVTEIKADHYRRHLDRFSRCAQNTICLEDSAVRCFSDWLYRQERVRRDEMKFVERPRRVPPEELDVTSVTSGDVMLMLSRAESWPERLAVNVPVYMGPRRQATARARRGDFQYRDGLPWLRFREKGGKTIWKPVPPDLAGLIEAATSAGAYDNQTVRGSLLPRERAYLVPPEGDLHRDERDDRIIWRLVKRVASRAGVEAHVHALRAAFAVFYMENVEGADEHALQDLMGHRNPATTQVYLRRLNRETRMGTVRGLSWTGSTGQMSASAPVGGRATRDELNAGSLVAGSQTFTQIPEVSQGYPFVDNPVVGAGGFEPPFTTNPHEHWEYSERRVPDIGYDLAASLRRTLEEVPA